MREVSYFAPTEVGEAVNLLAEHGAKATVLAGGTDLLPKINHYDLKPEAILFIGGLGLDAIKEENGKLVIGAATSTAKIAASDLVAEKAGALAEAAQASGSVAIRTAATIGGNIANASPGADMVAALLALDAEFKLVSAGGDRTVAAKDFFLGPHESVLKPDELLTEVNVPVPKGKTVFLKLGRRHAQTLSVASVAVQLEMEGATCKDARIVLGAMAPTPLRCTKAEGMIKGKSLDEGLVAKCAAEAVDESSPIDDQRATAWYRKRAANVLVARALAQAAGI
ncbi:MAG TPA: xanthine dehydrogenase family protein subunit M [Anaerolineae bacterium]|nr:xanthine dehydrogenase family protein subunit M [Anaerolineae bacterium]